MSKHEARLKKQYSKTLEETLDLIDARLQQDQDRMKEAMMIRHADKLDGCTTNLWNLGFVFPDEQVDAALQAKEAFYLAKQVRTSHR